MDRWIERLVALLFALGVAVASPGAAADNTDGTRFDDIRKQQIELRSEAVSGTGIFESMEAAERRRLTSLQDELLGLIEGKDAIGELADPDQVRVFNLLEQINAMVNDLGEQQVICEYRRKTGSHRKEKVCMTVAERRQQRDAAQRAMDETLLRFCNPNAVIPTCGE